MTVLPSPHEPTRRKVAAAPRTQAIVISHTHWDREWYLTQKQFQFLLGDTLDAVIDALEHERGFRCFMADGQTSVIHDYLEIRPAQRDPLLRLIQQERLIVGPWYTMPDLWLPSGESLIRNLLRGRLDCERLGVKWQPVGYVPDSFGHIEQMPQILNGFGITTYFFSRGKAEASPAEERAFAWMGPDNQSKLIAHHLHAGYCNAPMLPPAESDALKDRLGVILQPYRNVGANQGPILLFNGTDHVGIQRDLPKIIERAAQILPDIEFTIGTLQTFIHMYEQLADIDNLPRRYGCLRDTNLLTSHLHGTWSSRIDNKLENASVASTLEGLAEPAAAVLIVAGGPNRRSALSLAWQSVLQSHAHDSICGCSNDAVHADVAARFRHAGELAEMIAADAIRKLVGEPVHPVLVRLAGLGGASACCEVLVDTSDERPVRIVGPGGEVYPAQRLGLRKLRRHDCLIPDKGDDDKKVVEFFEHRLLVLLPEAAPLELQRFIIEPDAAPMPDPRDIAHVLPNSLENRFIRVDVLPNGLLRLLHKPTGQVHDRLLELLDDADAGGGYAFKPLVPDIVERSGSCLDIRVNVIEDGPVRGTLGVCASWALPAGLNQTKEARLSERVVCDVEFQISLAADEDQLNCRLHLANRAIEHRVRLNIPLPFRVERVNVERAFVVADEDLTRFTAEPGQNTHPMRNWIAASAGGMGLAFVGGGLHEYAVEDSGASSDLRMTLLRSVPFVDFCGAWRTPDAEMRRELDYEFALIPFAGDWRGADIARRAHRFIHRSAAEAVGDRRTAWDHLPHATTRLEEWRQSCWIPTASHRSGWRRHFGERDGWRRSEQSPSYPPIKQLIAIDGDQILLSCVKPAERSAQGGDDVSDDLIVRFHSVAERDQTVAIQIGFPLVGIWESDLAETPLQSLSVTDSAVQLPIRPYEIKTLRLRPART